MRIKSLGIEVINGYIIKKNDWECLMDVVNKIEIYKKEAEKALERERARSNKFLHLLPTTYQPKASDLLKSKSKLT